MTQTKPQITRTTKDGAVINDQFVPWSELEDAAKQDDADLAALYAAILADARRAESARLEREAIAADWREFGYPLRTGYDQRFNGQIVSRAWEIRRKRYSGNNGPVDARIAYIVSLDRSDRSTRRDASPEFVGDDAYSQAERWILERYSVWSEELGNERTATVWFRG